METWHDPRGPERSLEAIEYTARCTLITLSCGHVSECNAIYAYKIGSTSRFMKCRRKDAST